MAGLVSDTNHDILVQELTRLEHGFENPLLSLLEASNPAPVIPSRSLLEPITREVVKDIIPPLPTEEKAPLREFGAVSVKKNSRQSIIIGLLKRKKEIMIKDVSPLISGCSEKTIQRELSEMVAAGILRKMGEKRWTRYTLA